MDTYRFTKIRINDWDREYDGKLIVDTEMVPVTSINGSDWDPTWSMIDDAGHWHGYDNKGDTPTLVTRSVPIKCTSEDCGACTAVTQHCRICEQEISPRRIRQIGERFIPGRTTWQVLLDTADLITPSEVVVRALGEGWWFGVARVVLESAVMGQSTPGVHRYRLHGISPLGVRREP